MQTCSPDYLIADIVAECPGAPGQLIQRSLMRAAQRLMAVTCMNEVWVDIPTQHNVQHYPFERYLPKGYSVQYVAEVMYNNCCIECVDDDCTLCPTGYRLDDLTQITLMGYNPQSDGKRGECLDKLKVKVVLRPNNDLCELPCDLISRFEPELRDGTLGNLLAIKGKDWTDFRAAEFYENRFEGGVASAKALVANKMRKGQCVLKPECLL